MAIVISGVNNNDKITASDGTIDVLSGVTYNSEITVHSLKLGNNIQLGNAGIITATSFVGNISGTTGTFGDFLNVGSNIQLGNAGVATATTFVGNLTGNVNNTGNLLLQIGGSEKFRGGGSGQLGIGGANYGTSGQVLTSGGSGSAATWSTISGTTINNNADNRVITGSGTANTLNGEANLTFDGTNLTSTVSGNSGIVVAASGNNAPQIKGQANRSAQNNTLLSMHGVWNGTDVTMIDLQAGPDTSNKDDGQIGFYTRPSGSSMVQRMLINSRGSVGINTVSADDPLNPGLHIHGSANDNCRISFSTPTKSAPGSRIGYYGLNRFGIDTYDGIEMRDVTRSYATIFKIDQNGYMTNSQPYAYFRFNAHSDTGSLQKQTNVGTVTVESGMAHDGSGRFTVPVTGKYLIGSDNNVLDNADHYCAVYINGANQAGMRYQNQATNSSNANVWKSSSRTCILNLSANDYVEIYIKGAQDNAAWNQHFIYLIG